MRVRSGRGRFREPGFNCTLRSERTGTTGFDARRCCAEHFDAVEVRGTVYGQPGSAVTNGWEALAGVRAEARPAGSRSCGYLAGAAAGAAAPPFTVTLMILSPCWVFSTTSIPEMIWPNTV